MNHKNDADWHCDKRPKTFGLLLFLSQYGYRLPQEENVFYNVHFYYIQGKTFTYPLSTNKQELRSSHDPQITQFSIFPLLKKLSYFKSLSASQMLHSDQKFPYIAKKKQISCQLHTQQSRDDISSLRLSADF